MEVLKSQVSKIDNELTAEKNRTVAQSVVYLHIFSFFFASNEMN